jgi:hypothetical protein
MQSLPPAQSQRKLPAPAGQVMTYTGDGLAYQGIQLVTEGPGQPLLLANTITNPVGPTADDLKIEPVTPPGAQPSASATGSQPPAIIIARLQFQNTR